MKHRSSQIIFRHWNDLRAQRALPERADIDPAQVRSALADTFILSYNTVEGHRFRLAGTRLCALLGRELKDAQLVPLWRTMDRPGIERLISTAVEDSIGVVAAITGRTTDEVDIDLELLLLPLKHGGKTHLRMIGTLAPVGSLPPVTAQPIGAFRLGDYRYLGHNAEPPPRHPAPLLQAPSLQPPDRIRYGLAVYDGGRSERRKEARFPHQS